MGSGRIYPSPQVTFGSRGTEHVKRGQSRRRTATHRRNLEQISRPCAGAHTDQYHPGYRVFKKYRFPITGWHSLRPYKIGIVRGILFAEQQTVGMDRLVLETLFLYHYVHVSRSDLVEKLEPVFRVLRIKS